MRIIKRMLLVVLLCWGFLPVWSEENVDWQKFIDKKTVEPITSKLPWAGKFARYITKKPIGNRKITIEGDIEMISFYTFIKSEKEQQFRGFRGYEGKYNKIVIYGKNKDIFIQKQKDGKTVNKKEYAGRSTIDDMYLMIFGNITSYSIK